MTTPIIKAGWLRWLGALRALDQGYTLRISFPLRNSLVYRALSLLTLYTQPFFYMYPNTSLIIFCIFPIISFPLIHKISKYLSKLFFFYNNLSRYPSNLSSSKSPLFYFCYLSVYLLYPFIYPAIYSIRFSAVLASRGVLLDRTSPDQQ